MRVLDCNNWVIIEKRDETSVSGLITTDSQTGRVISSPDGKYDGKSVVFNDKAAVPYMKYLIIDISQIYFETGKGEKF